MPDKRKVIRGLECCGTKDHCHFGEDGCPYYFPENPDDCTSRLARAALALLREQEPVDAIRDSEAYGKGEFGVWWYACGNCHGVIDYKDPFCRHCGREVKWDADD